MDLRKFPASRQLDEQQLLSLLFSLKELGIGHCVGLDQADLDRQRPILKQVTGIHKEIIQL